MDKINLTKLNHNYLYYMKEKKYLKKKLNIKINKIKKN